jgi:hypothetical protein
LVASAKTTPRTQETALPPLLDSGATEPVDSAESGIEDLFIMPGDGEAVGADVDSFNAGESTRNVPFDETRESLDTFEAPDDGAADLDPFSGDESVDN